jgi:hypothetical protein
VSGGPPGNDSDDSDEGNGRSGVQLGGYIGLVVDGADQVLERLEIVAEKRFPCVGEAIDILRDDGSTSSFRVLDIRHPEEPSEQFLTHHYTGLVAILMRDDRPRPEPGGARHGEESAPPSGPKALAVLEFRARLPNPGSPTYNFVKLLAWAVAVGYRDQRVYFEALKHLAWQLGWDGRRWLMRQITSDRSPEELRELSRAAKRAGLDAERYLEQLLAIPAAPGDDLAEVISLDRYRR